MPVAKFKLVDRKEWFGKIRYRFEDISVNGERQRQFRLILIYIEPEYRNRGFGKKIMNYIIDKARKTECKCIVIDLTEKDYDYYSSHEERIKFFEKFGFRFDKEGSYGRLELDKTIDSRALHRGA